MYFKRAEWSTSIEADAREARSIGSILCEMREVAGLLATRRTSAQRSAGRGNPA